MSERPIKTIVLKNGYQVEIVTFMTWGEKEEINEVLIAAANISNSGGSITGVNVDPKILRQKKYKAFETCIKKIISPEGVEQPFSKEWINELDVEDGDLIYNEVLNLEMPKKN